MKRLYYDEPEWVEKSIVYFCDNYTIDERDLGKLKAGAIKEYRSPQTYWEGASQTVCSRRIDFDESPQGWDFWDCLSYLQGVWEALFQEVLCPPWTPAEKRAIDKMRRPK